MEGLSREYISSRLGRRMLSVFAACALLPVTALTLVSVQTTSREMADLAGIAFAGNPDTVFEQIWSSAST